MAHLMPVNHFFSLLLNFLLAPLFATSNHKSLAGITTAKKNYSRKITKKAIITAALMTAPLNVGMLKYLLKFVLSYCCRILRCRL